MSYLMEPGGPPNPVAHHNGASGRGQPAAWHCRADGRRLQYRVVRQVDVEDVHLGRRRGRRAVENGVKQVGGTLVVDLLDLFQYSVEFLVESGRTVQRGRRDGRDVALVLELERDLPGRRARRGEFLLAGRHPEIVVLDLREVAVDRCAFGVLLHRLVTLTQDADRVVARLVVPTGPQRFPDTGDERRHAADHARRDRDGVE